MTFELEKLEGEPIVIATYLEPYNARDDVLGTNRDVAELLENHEGKLYFINDISQVKLNFNQIFSTLVSAFSDRSTLPPDRIHGIAVGTGSMLQSFVNTAKKAQFGNINIDLFNSREEAIEFARSLVATGK